MKTTALDDYPSPEEWEWLAWLDDPDSDPSLYAWTFDEGWVSRKTEAPRRPRKPALDWIEETIDGLPSTLTVDEARAALRMSRRNFYRLTATGRIRARRAVERGSSRLLIPRAELVRYLKSL